MGVGGGDGGRRIEVAGGKARDVNALEAGERGMFR